MRKYQHERQEETKIKFNTSINLSNVGTEEGKKIGYFKMVTPKKERNGREGSKGHMEGKKNQSTSNYRTPTENSMKKYTFTLKNNAYNSVFGANGIEKVKGRCSIEQY
jgi:hypothetical protein